MALLFSKDNKVEVLEQAVEHFQALEFEAMLEGMFQKFDNKIASHAQTSVREAVRVGRRENRAAIRPQQKQKV